MRKHSWESWRDLTVRLLARLSLVVVLAVLGALFVGSAATSRASEPTVSSAADHTQRDVRDQARPAGLVLGAVVIGGGLAVLIVGAFRPPVRTERRAPGVTPVAR